MSRTLSFGHVELLLDERQLLIHKRPVTVGARAFDVLVALSERRDRVVSKDELLDIVWPGVVVEENNLSVQISALRKVLGAHAIATVTGRGYRFVLPADDKPCAPPPAEESAGRIVRRLAAIACAEVVGWAAALGRDRHAAAAAWRRLRGDAIESCVGGYGGRIIRLTADDVLVEFVSAVDAVRWAIELQRRAGSQAEAANGARPLAMRVAISVEDLIVDDGRPLGEPASSARTLLAAAAPGQVLASPAARLFADGRLAASFSAVGNAADGSHHGRDTPAAFIVEPVRQAHLLLDHRLVPNGEPALGSRPTVAVLPFAVDAVEVDAYFGDGMTEEIVTSLSVNRALFVIARSSTLRYRGSTQTSAEIAAELGVRYLLSGTVRRTGTRLRIGAELIDAGANRIIWAERFDGADEDIFGFQSQIAASIAAAIDPRVQEAEIARVVGRPTDSLSAYDSVLRGLSLLYSFKGNDFETAGHLFRRAIELDRDYAQAHAHLAWWHNLRFGEGRSPVVTEDGRQAEALSMRAVELDPRDATVLSVAGHVQSFMRRRFRVAMGLFDQALSVNPNCAAAWARSATTMAYMGEGEAALQRVRNAMRLSPFDPLSFAFCTTNGTAALVAGRSDEAAGWLAKARRLNPRYRAATRMLIAALALSGEHAEAAELAAEFVADEPEFQVATFGSWYPMVEPHLTRLLDGMRLGGLPG